MGCDIHLYVERCRPGDGKWVTCDKWTKGENGNPSLDYHDRFYHNRNYDLFAIFADVRNGRGFAGIKTGEGFIPIASPRGIPDDCCPEYRAETESWGVDGHSHSWLTAAEIMAFDWTQTTNLSGVVCPKEWARWKKHGCPYEWSGAVEGAGVIHVTPEDMENAANKVTNGDLWKLYHDKDDLLSRAIYQSFGGTQKFGGVFTGVTWTIPYYDAGKEFLSSALPKLWRLGKPEDVRIVFFFDN